MYDHARVFAISRTRQQVITRHLNLPPVELRDLFVKFSLSPIFYNIVPQLNEIAMKRQNQDLFKFLLTSLVNYDYLLIHFLLC